MYEASQWQDLASRVTVSGRQMEISPGLLLMPVTVDERDWRPVLRLHGDLLDWLDHRERRWDTRDAQVSGVWRLVGGHALEAVAPEQLPERWADLEKWPGLRLRMPLADSLRVADWVLGTLPVVPLLLEDEPGKLMLVPSPLEHVRLVHFRISSELVGVASLDVTLQLADWWATQQHTDGSRWDQLPRIARHVARKVISAAVDPRPHLLALGFDRAEFEGVTERQVHELHWVAAELTDSLDPPGPGQWFRSGNRMLGRRRPLDVILEGDVAAVSRAVRAYVEGGYV